jgi:YD repeat-containing protein
MKAFLFVSFFLFFAPRVFAQQPCPDKFEVFDNTQIQTIEADGVCMVSIHPRNSENLLYRDFLFDSAGLFMIFDSYGQGPESQTTAAREYLFFPRQQALSYRYNAEAKRVEVTAPNGKVFSFDSVKSILREVSGTTLDLNYEVIPANRGGVEIVKNDGLFMDGGFTRGQGASQNPKGKVTFKDPQQKSCGLVNWDVYKYDSDQDATFRFSDGQLKEFLAARCPQLKY